MTNTLQQLFRNCLKEYTNDEVTVISPCVFRNQTNLKSVSFPLVEEIQMYAFFDCVNLESINIPNVTVMRNGTGANTNANGYFFSNCKKLQRVNMPKLENMYGNHAFSSSGTQTTNGMTIVLPKIQNLGVRAFRGAKCAAVDLGSDLVGILADTFYNGTYGAVILRKASVVSAATTDSIRGLTNVYVPQSLISSYQTASNWSTRYNDGYITFHAIEGSQYEDYYADGTPIE